MRILRWRADLVLAFLSLIGFAFLYRETFNFPPSPVRGQPGAALFPRAILILLFVTTALLAVSAVIDGIRSRKVAAEVETFDFDWLNFGWTILIVGLFTGLLATIGFEATSFLLLSVLLRVAYGMWPKAIVMAAISTVLLYVIFVLGLGVGMPLAFLPTFVNF